MNQQRNESVRRAPYSATLSLCWCLVYIEPAQKNLLFYFLRRSVFLLWHSWLGIERGPGFINVVRGLKPNANLDMVAFSRGERLLKKSCKEEKLWCLVVGSRNVFLSDRSKDFMQRPSQISWGKAVLLSHAVFYIVCKNRDPNSQPPKAGIV